MTAVGNEAEGAGLQDPKTQGVRPQHALRHSAPSPDTPESYANWCMATRQTVRCCVQQHRRLSSNTLGRTGCAVTFARPASNAHKMPGPVHRSVGHCWMSLVAPRLAINAMRILQVGKKRASQIVNCCSNGLESITWKAPAGPAFASCPDAGHLWPNLESRRRQRRFLKASGQWNDSFSMLQRDGNSGS